MTSLTWNSITSVYCWNTLKTLGKLFYSCHKNRNEHELSFVSLGLPHSSHFITSVARIAIPFSSDLQFDSHNVNTKIQYSYQRIFWHMEVIRKHDESFVIFWGLFQSYPYFGFVNLFVFRLCRQQIYSYFISDQNNQNQCIVLQVTYCHVILRDN